MNAYDTTQATTFSPMECSFADVPKMYQEDTPALKKKKYPIYYYFKDTYLFAKQEVILSLTAIPIFKL